MAAVELTGGECAAAAGASTHRRPVVVLGASNVARGLARLVAALRARSAQPTDLFVAAGHGRSYGAASRVWLRRLPSILRCGLWRALDRDAGSAPPRALVTDIGNDLLYGFSVEQVADWVRAVVCRLADRGAAIAVTRLPLASVAGVGPVRYRLLRTLYVPGCPLALDELKDAAVRLDAAVAGIASECGAALLDQPPEWYGLDAIHLRRACLDALWGRACDAWDLTPAAGRPRASVREWAGVGSRAAEVRSLAGRLRFTRQPVAELPAAIRLSLY